MEITLTSESLSARVGREAEVSSARLSRRSSPPPRVVPADAAYLAEEDLRRMLEMPDDHEQGLDAREGKATMPMLDCEGRARSADSESAKPANGRLTSSYHWGDSRLSCHHLRARRREGSLRSKQLALSGSSSSCERKADRVRSLAMYYELRTSEKSVIQVLYC